MKVQTICLRPKMGKNRDFKNFNEKSFLQNVKLKNLSRKSDNLIENHEFLSYQFQSLVDNQEKIK